MQKIDFDQLRNDIDGWITCLIYEPDGRADLRTELRELLDQPEEAYDELLRALDDATTELANLNEKISDTEYVADDYITGCARIHYKTITPVDAEIMEALGDLLKGGRYLDILNYLKSY